MSQDKGHDCGCGCGGHGQASPGLDLGIDWASADETEIVCPCRGVNKGQVLAAIEQGAYTLPLLKTMTGAGRGGDCRTINPRGRSCEADLARLLEIHGGDPYGACFTRVGCS